MKEIKASIPGCEYYERKNFQIRGVIKEAIKQGFTDLMLFYEKNGIPRKSKPNIDCIPFDRLRDT